MKSTISILFLFCALSPTFGAKILTVIPAPAKSHYAIGNAIVKSLLEAGHELTVIQAFPSSGNHPKRRDIVTDNLMEFASSMNKLKNPFEFGNMGPLFTEIMLFKMGKTFQELTFKNEGVKKLMSSGEKFDVCIYEIFAVDGLVGIGQHFDCHLIAFATFNAVKWINQLTSNPTAHAYVPNPFLDYTAQMSFPQRLWNTVYSHIEDGLHELIYYPDQRKLYKKHFPNSKSTFDEDLKNVSLVFTNAHFSSFSVRPSLPNVIEIAGVHVDKEKPLPKEWQTFLDNEKDGVIYFSMGSMLKSTDWPEDRREALVKAFGKLKHKVIWKYENDTLPNQPKNVKIGKWLPQRDILAHPNVKVFITHGGLLGTTESIVAGKPVLGIPIYGDQKMNIAKAIEAGYGLKVDFVDVTEEKITKALNELLKNPKYYDTAQTISKQFNDRPMTPQESVVYWTEYVIRHNGAANLKSPGHSLSFIEFYLIDVYFTCVVIGVLLLIIFCYIMKFLIRKCLSKNKEKVKKN